MHRRFQFSLRALFVAMLVFAGFFACIAQLRRDELPPLDITNDPFNVAINGEAFFQVIGPTATTILYTRVGTLAVNDKGLLVIGSPSEGHPVEPQISLPIDAAGIVISGEGVVWLPQLAEYSKVGQLQLAKFSNPRRLLRVGKNFYRETPSSGAAVLGLPGAEGFGSIFQNCLEQPRTPVTFLPDFARHSGAQE